MIIKSTRVPARQASKLVEYLSQRGSNETISWLRGRPADLSILAEISKLAGKKFAVRHFTVSPSQHMSRDDLSLVLDEICNEYDILQRSRNRIAIVQHTKYRASGADNEIHWHLAVPETDAETLTTLSSSFFKMRNEKISRLVELRLNHRIVLGRFNKGVFKAIQNERPELDLSCFETTLRQAAIEVAMDEDRWLGVRVRAPYSDKKLHTQDRKLNAIADELCIDISNARLPMALLIQRNVAASSVSNGQTTGSRVRHRRRSKDGLLKVHHPPSDVPKEGYKS
jgi:hypothetical protein